MFVALLDAGLAKVVAVVATAALVLVAAFLTRGWLPSGLSSAGNGHRALEEPGAGA